MAQAQPVAMSLLLFASTRLRRSTAPPAPGLILLLSLPLPWLLWQGLRLPMLPYLFVLLLAIWRYRGRASAWLPASDVRQDLARTPATTYDPRPLLDPQRGWMLGLDAGEPCYLNGPLPHLQVIGGSGCGKSAALGVLAAQALAQGESVIYFDPKEDLWAASALAAAAAHCGRRFHVLDLRPQAPAQFNLIEGCDPHRLYDLLLHGLDLLESGSDADFYRLADRQGARLLAEAWRPGDTLASLTARAIAPLRRKAPALCLRLEEIAGIAAGQGLAGPRMSDLLAQGDACYILGSTRLDTVRRLQRIVLLRLIQSAEAQARPPERPCCVILDEFRYHLCRGSLDALSTIRDRGVHLILAHQSLGDLAAGPGDLNATAVAAAVNENCALKLVFRLQDPDTAEWLARKSGQVPQRRQHARYWPGLADPVIDGEQEASGPLISATTLLHLPARVAVLYGHGRARELTQSAWPCARRAWQPIATPDSRCRPDLARFEEDA